jgi:hypothetical protein
VTTNDATVAAVNSGTKICVRRELKLNTADKYSSKLIVRVGGPDNRCDGKTIAANGNSTTVKGEAIQSL